MAKIVYLDHQIVVDRDGWRTIKSLSDAGKIRVAISSWTIREIVQGMRERNERMEFIVSITPLYVIGLYTSPTLGEAASKSRLHSMSCRGGL